MNISLNKDTHLSSFSTIDVKLGETYNIEYFPKTYATLKLFSTSSNELENSLNELSDGNPVSVDFEWKPDITTSFHPISIFQLCSSKGIIVIENDDILLSNIINDNKNDNNSNNEAEKDITNVKNYNILKNFLMNHKLFGKGTHTDKLKLKMMFDYEFEIEDIEVTYLKPNNLPLGFSGLVQKLIGRPSAFFKDPKISRSDWSKRPLSVLQLLYAGFDAYAMHLCYNRIIKLSNDELKTLLSVENKSIYTKKHKLKADIDQKQSLNLKIKFLVSFSDHLKESGSLRNQEVDPMKFVQHEEYSTKYSLFYMFLALRKIQLLNDQKNANNDFINTNNNNNNDDDDDENSNFNTKNNSDDQYRCDLCNLILPNKNATINHLWSKHYLDIPSIYFLWQSPAYLSGCIKQIAFSSQNLIAEGDHIKCGICGKQLQKFRNLYTHFRIYHMNITPSDQITSQKNESEIATDDNEKPKVLTPDDYTHVEYGDLKQILFDHLNKTSKINKEKKICHICESFLAEKDESSTNQQQPFSTSSVKIADPKVNFETEEELIEHCWNNHPGIFISLWKHRPSLYPKDLFEKCSKFGVVSIEKLLSGTMYNGVYACSFCLVGFDSPGELFIHLFHRHTVIQAVKASEIEIWPLKVKDMPLILQNLIKKMAFADIIAELEKQGIVRVDKTAEIKTVKEEPKKLKVSKKQTRKKAAANKKSENQQDKSQTETNEKNQQKVSPISNESNTQNQQQSETSTDQQTGSQNANKSENHTADSQSSANLENQTQSKTSTNQQTDSQTSDKSHEKSENHSSASQTSTSAQNDSQNANRSENQPADSQTAANLENQQQSKTSANQQTGSQTSDKSHEKSENHSSASQTSNESLPNSAIQSNESQKSQNSDSNPLQSSDDKSETKKMKKCKSAKPEDDKLSENNGLELYPFYCIECQGNFGTIEERWAHLLEKHLIIDFTSIRYRCHDDLPYLNED